MVSTLEQQLLDAFREAAGVEGPDGTAEAAAAQFADALADAAAKATGSTAKSSSSQTTQTTNKGGSGSSMAATLLKSGFGVLPLIGALFGLFGGGEDPAPEPLVKYAMPARLDVEAAATESGWSGVDYDQFGMPRANPGSRDGRRPAPMMAGDGAVEGGRPSTAPQITVNVQAMDARSFMDRSGDIAAAVRNAMLNLNSINDVVNDI